MTKGIWGFCLGAGLLLAIPGAATAADEAHDFLKRGVFSEGRLWLLDDEGRLMSLDETQADVQNEALPEPVSDICRVDDSLIALTGNKGAAAHVRRHAGGRWVDMGTITLGADDGLVGLACDGHSVAVLSRSNLYEVSDHPRVIALHPPHGKFRRGVLTVFATAKQVYVGSNAGEWGGSLHVVDRTTGEVSGDQPPNGRTCDALLCDDITGLSILPWRSDCLAVTSGVVHFLSGGGVYTLCPGGKAQAFYSKAAAGEMVDKDGKPIATVAFYGVVPDGEDLLVAGMDGLYRLDKDGKATITPLPPFKTIGDIRVSFALPNVILVQTEIYRRTSVSGPVPLLIPR